MWTAKEVALIGETLNKYYVEDILTSEELDAIPSSALKNIRSGVIEPKHKHKVCYNIIWYHVYLILWYHLNMISWYHLRKISLFCLNYYIDETNYLSKYRQGFGCL